MPRGGQAGVNVVLGEHDKTKFDKDHEIKMGVSDIVKHPDNKKIPGTRIEQYDIALIKLQNDIDFAKYANIRPVCLPESSNREYTGFQATVTGWGSTNEKGTKSKILKEIDGVVLSNLDCLKAIGCVRKGHNCSVASMQDQMICVKYHGGKTCGGDSGGALVTKENIPNLIITYVTWK